MNPLDRAGHGVRLGIATLGALLAVGVAITAATAPAAAKSSCQNGFVVGKLASAGGNSYVLNVSVVKDTGSICSFELETVTATGNLRPGSICHQTDIDASTHYGYTSLTRCVETVEAGQSTQICFDGGEASASGATPYLYADDSGLGDNVGTAPAVSGCPLKGGSAPTCRVPRVKGKALASAKRAIANAHCAVGKVKRVTSQHTKKGIVISQKPPAGSTGTKVSLVVSKGK